MALSERPYLFNSASAADKHEANSLALSKLTCGIEQRVERVAGTVIPRVHHDELVRESVHGTKLLSRIGIKRDLVVMGPGRYCEDLHRIYSSRQDTFLHETIKDHYVCRASQTEPEKCFQEALRARPGHEPARSDRLIGVQVHDPEHKAPSFESSQQSRKHADQRRRSHRNNDVK